MSSIPWETRVTWYNKAQENFPEFAHCRGLWVFEEALRQRMSGRGKYIVLYFNTIKINKFIIFILKAYYRRHRSEKLIASATRRTQIAQKAGRTIVPRKKYPSILQEIQHENGLSDKENNDIDVMNLDEQGQTFV
jgi:hypothetical protein